MNAILYWFERHKFGIIGTLTVHTILLFLFTMKDMQSVPTPAERSDMDIEIISIEDAEQMLAELETDESVAREKIVNLSSNVTAQQTMSSFSPQRLAERVEDDLKRFEQEEFDRLKSERQERGEEVTIPELDPSKWNKERYMDKPAVPVKVEGKALVEYSLEGRVDHYLHRPGFQCPTGGIVQLNVSVSGDGRVEKADVDPSASSTTDECLIERALRSARTARFDPVSGARSQKGWIKYTFMSQ